MLVLIASLVLAANGAMVPSSKRTCPVPAPSLEHASVYQINTMIAKYTCLSPYRGSTYSKCNSVTGQWSKVNLTCVNIKLPPDVPGNLREIILTPPAPGMFADSPLPNTKLVARPAKRSVPLADSVVKACGVPPQIAGTVSLVVNEYMVKYACVDRQKGGIRWRSYAYYFCTPEQRSWKGSPPECGTIEANGLVHLRARKIKKTRIRARNQPRALPEPRLYPAVQPTPKRSTPMPKIQPKRRRPSVIRRRRPTRLRDDLSDRRSFAMKTERNLPKNSRTTHSYIQSNNNRQWSNLVTSSSPQLFEPTSEEQEAAPENNTRLSPTNWSNLKLRSEKDLSVATISQVVNANELKRQGERRSQIIFNEPREFEEVDEIFVHNEEAEEEERSRFLTNENTNRCDVTRACLTSGPRVGRRATVVYRSFTGDRACPGDFVRIACQSGHNTSWHTSFCTHRRYWTYIPSCGG